MKSSALVGRVGGLSVALGIGAVAGGFGVGTAAADSEDARVDNKPTRSAVSADDRGRHDGRDAKTSAPQRLGRVTGVATFHHPGAVTGDATSDTAQDASTPSTTKPSTTTPSTKVRNVIPRRHREVGIRVPVVAGELPVDAVTVAVAPPGPAVASVARPFPSSVAQQPVAPPAVIGLAEPSLPDSDPTAPGGVAVSSVVLAASRRYPDGASSAVSAAATGADPISALFFNQTPTAYWTQTGQNSLGVVSGVLWAADADSEDFTTTYTDGHSGEVVLADDGSYTYTPYSALSSTGFTDSFTVTMSDADSGFHIHGIGGLLNLLTFGLLGTSGHETTTTVSVTVAPYGRMNTAPTAAAVVGTNDPFTGVVTGTVTGTDPDGDPLTYSAPAWTSKGIVSIDAVSGQFTYTPTVGARQIAAQTGATPADKADSFTVTVTDGYGGSMAVPIAVAISPALPEPTVAFTSASVSRPEGDSGVTLVPVTVRLSATTYQPVTVYYDVIEQPLLSTAATPGVDFRTESGWVTIAAGQTDATINVAVYGDSDYETDELIRVELTAADGAVVASEPSSYRQTVTVRNDDEPAGALVSFKGWSVSQAEGDSGTTTVPVTIRLSAASDVPVTVYYDVIEQPLLSTAATPGVDFRSASGSVTIPAGQTEGIINVTVFGDTAYEADELVRVELTGADNGVIASSPSDYRQTVTILNDDQPAGALVGFTSASVSRAEGNSGTTTVPVTVQLSTTSESPVTVYYSVVEQPLLSTAATPWVDFVPESGSVTIAPGQTQGTINITVYGDTSYEADELIRVELTGVSGGVLNSDPSHYRKTVTITNDDPASPVV
ncbi:MAG: VCBS domain-containing protein [Mycobacterium sp.]|nr:VCBS domain-containing protein [Mycobacterium sp.]